MRTSAGFPPLDGRGRVEVVVRAVAISVVPVLVGVPDVGSQRNAPTIARARLSPTAHRTPSIFVVMIRKLTYGSVHPRSCPSAAESSRRPGVASHRRRPYEVDPSIPGAHRMADSPSSRGRLPAADRASDWTGPRLWPGSRRRTYRSGARTPRRSGRGWPRRPGRAVRGRVRSGPSRWRSDSHE